MFYLLSKLVGTLVLPSSIVAIVIAAGVVLLAVSRRRRLGLGLAFAGLLALAVAGFSPLGNLLVLPLEQRFSRPSADAEGQAVAGIIILGGAEDGWVSAGRPGELALNEAAERVTEGLRLALHHPEAKVVFTGGVGRLLGDDPPGAESVGAYLASVGIDRSRIVLEDRSRNTWENAAFTLPLINAKPGEHWLLVTSAYHMSRAVGCFRVAGLETVPYPVDYRTRGAEDLTRMFGSISSGLMRMDLGAEEWIGLVAFRVAGRTDALFPGPKAP